MLGDSVRTFRSLGCSLGAFILVATACAPVIKGGGTLYAEGRYIEAAEVFERTEARLDTSTARTRCEYGLYRGLTFLKLGDDARAREWLAYSYQLERKTPGTLDDGERKPLDSAWTAAESGNKGPPSDSTAVAQAGVSGPGQADSEPRALD